MFFMVFVNVERCMLFGLYFYIEMMSEVMDIDKNQNNKQMYTIGDYFDG